MAAAMTDSEADRQGYWFAEEDVIFGSKSAKLQAI